MTFSPEFEDLASMLKAAAERHGHRPLFGEKRGGSWRWMTYREFDGKVARFRGALRSLGVGPGDWVAVISNNRSEWAVGGYACFTSGVVYVPMYEMQLEKDWRYILRDSEARVCLVASSAIHDKVTAMRPDLPRLERILSFEAKDGDASFSSLLEGSAPSPAAAAKPSDPAIFIYTSGTTGNPKGVRLTHANLACNVSALRGVAPFSADERAMSILPWAHVGGLCELNVTILLGNAIGLCEGVDKIAENLLELRPTWLGAVPRIWHKFHDAAEKNIAAQPRALQRIYRRAMRAGTKRRQGGRLSLKDHVALAVAERVIYPKIRARLGGNIRYAVSGAAALARDALEFIENIGIPLREVYGMTEASAIATAMGMEDTRKLGSVGRPLPGVRIEIDRDVEGADGENGEILIYGHGVMAGYHGLPEESARALLPDGGLRTGDLGRLDEGGFLYITGRVKELYKLENGKFVAPVPIEERLCRSPLIAQAFVYGLNRPHNVALLVCDKTALTAWCEKNGSRAKAPEDSLADARVRELYAKEVERESQGLKGYERIAGLALTFEEFTTQNDQLTPTLKLKRRNVLARHEKALFALYG